ncbi:MAG: hypothetical protein HC897_16045 [Thermoanaerobaculia bacterium]|nr:hypothetical protein [Thermoanaerobaculia bacterium]
MSRPASASPGCPRAKAEGAFIALAAGDALGWPQEFRNQVPDRGHPAVTPVFRPWLRRSGGRYFPHEEPIRAGEYSDDTQLMLAVARCRTLVGKSWWKVLTRTELPLWTLYERGGGGATKRAAELWSRATPPWKADKPAAIHQYFAAGGNGVAMRVLPHAVFYAGDSDPELLIRDVVLDGVATHGHPRALVGATAYAFASWWLLRCDHTIRFGELVQVLTQNAKAWGTLPVSSQTSNGWIDAANQITSNGYASVWSQTVDEMRVLLERVQAELEAGAIADDDKILRDLGCFGEAKGAGTVSTAAAVYLCSRYAAQPLQAVLRPAFAHRADTDTLAAMSGGLVGCLAGKDWLPREWTQLQDHEYLCRMANEVARGPAATQDPGTSLRPIGRRGLDELRNRLFDGGEGGLDLDGRRRAEIIAHTPLKPLSPSTHAQSWQLKTEDGQTLYVTKLGRRPKEDARPVPQQQSLRDASTPSHATRTDYAAIADGLLLAVVNLRTMTAFYEGVLGLRPAQRSSQRVSYGALSLIDSSIIGKTRDDRGTIGGDARHHRIQIRVNDLDAAFHRVKASVGELAQSVTERPGAQRSFSCIDPEGKSRRDR